MNKRTAITAVLLIASLVWLALSHLPAWAFPLVVANAIAWFHVASDMMRASKGASEAVLQLEEIKAAGEIIKGIIEKTLRESGHQCRKKDKECYLCYVEQALSVWKNALANKRRAK
jgi:hypothetical protein